MHTSMNPAFNQSGLVDRYLGEAYKNVRLVADALPWLNKLAANPEELIELAKALPSIHLFIQNPDFMTWLEDNQALLADLNDMVNAISVDVVRQKQVTGIIPRPGYTTYFAQPIFDTSKIVGISGVIRRQNGSVIPLVGSAGLTIWTDAVSLYVKNTSLGADIGDLPFTALISYGE